MKKAENPFKNVVSKAENLVAQMTLEEKASLCSCNLLSGRSSHSMQL